jgi:hypothetical protein
VRAPRAAADPAAPARAAPAHASAVAEAEPAAATPVEKTGPAFGALKDIEAIQEVLPHRCAPALAPRRRGPAPRADPRAHRYPFLLVDRVVELEPQSHAVGYKCVSANDNFFTGHFPERKIMPGARPARPSRSARRARAPARRLRPRGPAAQACCRWRRWRSWAGS